MSEDKKKRYVQVTFNGSGYTAPLEFAVTELKTMFEEGEVGDTLEFKVVEMTEKELNDLPEFQGW